MLTLPLVHLPAVDKDPPLGNPAIGRVQAACTVPFRLRIDEGGAFHRQMLLHLFQLLRCMADPFAVKGSNVLLGVEGGR